MPILYIVIKGFTVDKQAQIDGNGHDDGEFSGTLPGKVRPELPGLNEGVAK